MRAAFVITCIFALAISPSVGAAEIESGNWKLSYPNGTGDDSVEAIIQIDHEGSQWKTKLVAANKKSGVTNVKSIAVDGGQIRITIDRTGTDYLFEGVINGDKSIRGSYGAGDRLRAARLERTEDAKLEPGDLVIHREVPDALRTFDDQRNAISDIRRKLAKAKGDEAKELREELRDKQKELNTSRPKLLREALAKSKDPAITLESAWSLLRNIRTDRATVAEVEQWSNDIMTASEEYGPRLRNETLLQLGELLVQQSDYVPIALKIATKANAVMSSDANPARIARRLNVTVEALRRSGQADAAKKLQPELESAEAALDISFVSKLPKVDNKEFAGRKAESGRAVLMELFTGSECPPCVAADYAFELAQDAYKPTELIAIQYHMHIPSPDPMTNPDNESRWKYYSSAFPKIVQGTPTAVFCGKPTEEADGGSLPMTGRILKSFRKSIDADVEEPPQSKIVLDVKREGAKLAIHAHVSDVSEPGDKVRLRFALVESNVRFQGSNGFRFHHNVVRHMPGGADGFPLTDSEKDVDVKVDLSEVRSGLEKYLDEFARDRLSFPKPQRPLDLKKLKVVAFVQDDASHTVRHAVQVAVADEK